MSRSLFASIVVMVLAGFVLAQDKSAPAQTEAKTKDKDKMVLSKEEKGVIEFTNAERKAANLEPLVMNPKLMAAARSHAANMAKQNKLNHVLDEKNPADRVKEAGYEYANTGENIAFNPVTPKEVVKGWMNSPPHQENLLKPEYTEIGVAVAKNKSGQRYWVQVFGKPRNK